LGLPDELLRQALFPFKHQAQLANAVTSFAICLGGIVPLLYCLLGRRQPARWMIVYACVLLTGIPTVWLHAYEGNRLASFFDVGTNIFLAWAMQVAVAGDFLPKPLRGKLLAGTGLANVFVLAWLAYEVVAPVKTPIVTFGEFGQFYVGEVALILNAFLAVGLFIYGYKTIPIHARPLLHLTVATFFVGMILATAGNSQVSLRVFAWHATWHLVGAFGFMTLWFFNHMRFGEGMPSGAPAGPRPPLR
jgi:hypothetical protein